MPGYLFEGRQEQQSKYFWFLSEAGDYSDYQRFSRGAASLVMAGMARWPRQQKEDAQELVKSLLHRFPANNPDPHRIIQGALFQEVLKNAPVLLEDRRRLLVASAAAGNLATRELETELGHLDDLESVELFNDVGFSMQPLTDGYKPQLHEISDSTVQFPDADSRRLALTRQGVTHYQSRLPYDGGVPSADLPEQTWQIVTGTVNTYGEFEMLGIA